MPIRWSAVKVSEAMDMTEEYINQIREPLKKARDIVNQARTIPGIPQYIDQYLMRTISEIDRTIGDGSEWNPEGQLKASIDLVRASIPLGAIEAEKEKREHGNQMNLTD
jgi:hypothetical protein